MKRYKNILVAFDGSSDSNLALEAAETLAIDNNAHLTVVYVHDKSVDKTVYYENPTSDDLHSQQPEPYIGGGHIPTQGVIHSNNKQTIIHDNKPDEVVSGAKIKLLNEIDVTYETLTGKPANVINDYAKNHEIDLIVIGNRGISGIKKLVMGSVSQKVTNEAECAVLVVK